VRNEVLLDHGAYNNLLCTRSYAGEVVIQPGFVIVLGAKGERLEYNY
jgi:hypothetical protein